MELGITGFVHLIYLHFHSITNSVKQRLNRSEEYIKSFPSPTHIVLILISTLSCSHIVALHPCIIVLFHITLHILPVFIILSSCILEQSNCLYHCILTLSHYIFTTLLIVCASAVFCAFYFCIVSCHCTSPTINIIHVSRLIEH